MSKAETLKTLMIEATRLHHHVAAASRQLADASDLTNAQVSVLRSLAAQGPRTVPELAAERAIARQPVQRMVLELEAQGFVRLGPNPRHKRSRLVAPTARGRKRLAEMEARQSEWTRAFGADVPEAELREAARVLRRVRERITQRAPGSGRLPKEMGDSR